MTNKFKGSAKVQVTKTIKINNEDVSESETATATATSNISESDAILNAENSAFNYALNLIDSSNVNYIYNKGNIVICKIVNTSSSDLVETIDNTDNRYYTYNVGWNLRFVSSPKLIMFPYNEEGALYAVKYGVQNNLRITVGSGHHCYENFVMKNDGGLLVNMYFMQNLTKENDYYIMEPGVTNWQMQQTLLANYNVCIPGGSCYSVGAGGHICGGGYGFLSREFGLTVDYLQGVEVVVVDENKNVEIVQCFKDSPTEKEINLWWSHTGGGGGSFGIITKYFFKNLPQPPSKVFLTTDISVPWYTTSGELISIDSFSTIINKYGNYLKMLNEKDIDNDLFAIFSVVYNSGSGNAFNCTIQATYKEAITNLVNYVFGDIYYTFLELPWLYATQTLNSSGTNQRFKNKSAYMEKPFEQREIEVLYKWYSGSYIKLSNYSSSGVLIDTYGGKINTVPPTATASVSRKSILKLQYFQYWNYKNDDDENLSWVSGLYNDMYGPNGPWNPEKGLAGCYINYPDCDLKNWQFLYWQENYNRLQTTKQQWDPNNIFNHAQSIELPS